MGKYTNTHIYIHITRNECVKPKTLIISLSVSLSLPFQFPKLLSLLSVFLFVWCGISIRFDKFWGFILRELNLDLNSIPFHFRFNGRFSRRPRSSGLLRLWYAFFCLFFLSLISIFFSSPTKKFFVILYWFAFLLFSFLYVEISV